MLKIRTHRFALAVLVAVVGATLMAPAAQARGRGGPTVITPPPPTTPPPPPAGIST